MFDGILTAMQNLVKEIYSVDQNQLDAKFVVFLDELNKLLIELNRIGYRVDITDEMLQMQSSYEKRDFLELADFIWNDFKNSIFELQTVIQEEQI